MFEILTSEDMKAAETKAMEAGISGQSMMQMAGASVAEEIKTCIDPCPVLILAGPGNNGGDGFVIARHLKAAGWSVRMACSTRRNNLKGDAALAAKEWAENIEELNSNLSLKDTQLIIDAVFGTGFQGRIPHEISTLFDKIRAKKIPVVAVDIPSGVDASTGSIADNALPALLTVTFCRKKLGHTLLPAKKSCGRVTVSDIGIPDQIITTLGTTIFENDPALWMKNFPIPDAETHKYQRGHVLVIGGIKTGAARLAAHAAQKIGAGVVSIASRPETASIYENYRASIMTAIWNDLDALKSILRDERINTVVIGPGLGTDSSTKDLVETVLSFNKKFILDADIFSLYQSSPATLFSCMPENSVLTPHEGEFARLFPDLAGHKIERAQKAAKISKATIVLKGNDTVIAAPDGTTIINTVSSPTLATAGSGDVLAGLTAGLTAQDMPPFMAAASACWFHGKTAQAYGFGLTAEDIIDQLNQTLNKFFIVK